MSKRIIVITSVVGNRDEGLRDDQVHNGEPFWAFVDRPLATSLWQLQPAYDRFQSSRRNSRVPKLLPHLFVEADYSIWLDANVALSVTPTELVATWLPGDAELAVFTHESRSCTFAEARICAQRQLDNPDLIRRQADRYRALGLPDKFGLGRCSVIVRRHTAAVQRFNEIWWSEYSVFSVRDQISFMPAVRTSGVKLHLVPRTILQNEYCTVNSRVAGIEPTVGSSVIAPPS